MSLIAGPRRALLTPRALRGEKYVRSLSPAAWFRKGVGITSAAGVASVWADQSGNGRNATGSAIDLPFMGTKYLYLPGVAGNYASSPDSVPLQTLTGSIDGVFQVSMNDWTPAASMFFCGKDTTSKRSFNFGIAITTGRPYVELYDTAATQKFLTASAAPTVSDGGIIWIRYKVTWAVAGNITCDFYTSSDGVNWGALGVQQTAAATGNAIGQFNNALFIGQREYPTFEQPLGGKIYRAKIYNGTLESGTLVLDFNAADGTDGASSFVSSTTGETWTINKSGALPAYLVGTSWLMSNGTSHTMATAAFVLDQPCTLFALAKDLTWTLNDYICDGAAKDSGALIQSATTPRFKVSAGSAIGENAGLAVETLGVRCAVINGANSLTRVNLGTPVTGNAGAAQMDGVTLFSSGAVATGFWNGMMQEFAAFPGAFTATQIAGVAAYLASVGSVELDS